MIDIAKYNKGVIFYSLLIISFIIVAFGQNAWIGNLAYLAAFCGYALFWVSNSYIENRKNRFLISAFWFFAIQLIQLSWMTSVHYVGALVLLVYVLLALFLGVQFGVISILLLKMKTLQYSRMFFIAALWTLMEWSRLFILSGFSWNPVGLALTNNHFSMQLATVIGVYGLSFWVILVNLLAYRSFKSKKVLNKVMVTWLIVFIFPYLFGYFHEKAWKQTLNENAVLSTLLIQTSLLPEEKDLILTSSDRFIPPILQWQRILSYVKQHSNKKLDLIVLPEAALPLGADTPFYYLGSLLQVFKETFDLDVISYLPELSPPLAYETMRRGEEVTCLTNLFWAQALSNVTGAEVIIGLDDRDVIDNKNYNAAFHCIPNHQKIGRYEKQVLVPLVEYFPFSWCESIMAKFGIMAVFTKGSSPKVFYGKVPLSVSICYEETYGNIMRQFRKKGAQIFVNVTNDGWFPTSRLPKQHFEHGKLRAVENGVSVIRACNTGVTGGIDCFGNIMALLDDNNSGLKEKPGALFLQVPTNNYPTLYTFWGDNFILIICFAIISIFVYNNRKKIK